jgi:hypothetical protein
VAGTETLSREARFFHQRIFNRPPSDVLVRRYCEAHQALLTPVPADQQASVDRIVRQELDCEALEFWFRLRGRRHLLSTKMRMVIYLAEVETGYFDLFVNSESRAVRAWLSAGLAVGRSMVSAVKGGAIAGIYRIS